MIRRTPREDWAGWWRELRQAHVLLWPALIVWSLWVMVRERVRRHD